MFVIFVNDKTNISPLFSNSKFNPKKSKKKEFFFSFLKRNKVNINKRVENLYQLYENSQTIFSENVGVKVSTLSNIVNNGVLPGFKVLEKILTAIPNLSAEWR